MENFVLEKTRSLKGLVSISSTVLPSPLGYLEKRRFTTYKQDITYKLIPSSLKGL